MTEKYKIAIQSAYEQDIPFKCPECGHDFFNNHHDCFLGWGGYPVGGHRQTMKPNRSLALFFECPKCFEKSCCHILQDDLMDFINAVLFHRRDFKVGKSES